MLKEILNVTKDNIVLGSVKITTLLKAKPTINTGEAKSFFEGFMKPAVDIGLWLIPTAFVAYMIWKGLAWYTKDEDEQESKPFKKTAKKAIIIAVIIYAADILVKIFGFGS